MVYRNVLTSVDHTSPIRLSTTGVQASTRSRPARSSTCQPPANNVQGLGYRTRLPTMYIWGLRFYGLGFRVEVWG